MVDSYDTPMVDYIEDADMSMVHSSSEAWFHHQQPSSSGMEEDRAMVDEHGFQATSLEIDMMTYEETTEYEMGDAANEEPVVQEIADAEVFDAALVPSPQPPQPQVITAPANPAVTNIFASEAHVAPQQEQTFHHIHALETTSIQSGDHAATAENIEFVPHSTTPVPTEEAITLTEPAEPTRDLQVQSTTENVTQQAFSPVDHSTEASQQDVANANAEGHEASQDDSNPALHRVAAEAQPQSDVATTVLSDHHSNVHQPDETAQHSGEKRTHFEHIEHHQKELQTTEQTYVDPPPSISLTLHVPSLGGGQPDFALFALPGPSVTAIEDGVATSNRGSAVEETLVLLQHRPSLFYEPISAVFEALRQEEYFSHLEDLVDSEMALNAADLQLVISEDNIYAREVSLQDLNAMHCGTGLSGPLRLVLQSVYPRFITRYNLLRDQITRLTVADGGEEPTQDQEQLEVVQGEEGGRTDEVESSVPVTSEQPGHQEADGHDASAVVTGEGVYDEVEESTEENSGKTHAQGTDDLDDFHQEEAEGQANRLRDGSIENGDSVLATNEVAAHDEGGSQAIDSSSGNAEKSDHPAEESTTNSDGFNDGSYPASTRENELAEVDDEDADGEDDPDAEGELDEQETEYYDVEQQQLEEDGAEGYGNELGEEGAEEPVLPVDDEYPHESGHMGPLVYEDGVAEDAGDELNVNGDGEQVTTTVADAAQSEVVSTEGAIALSAEISASSYDEDEFGDEFDDNEFGDEDEFVEEVTDHSTSNEADTAEEIRHITISEQDTLEDSQEERTVEHDPELHASEISEELSGEGVEDDFGDDDFGHVVGDELDDPTISGTAFENAQDPTQEYEDGLGSLSHVMRKNPSKRSLDDAEFDLADGEEELAASPDSKRTRTV